MERNHLIYDVPAVSSLPFRITNIRIHPDCDKQLKLTLPNDFLGLYLNMGSAFEYTGANAEPGIFLHNQCNFMYVPDIQRWVKDIPPLEPFLKGIKRGKIKFVKTEHVYFSGNLKAEIDRLLFSIWKDEYLGIMDVAATSFNIFLRCISEITNVSTVPKGNPGNSGDKVITDAAKYLTDNLSKNIKVEELASRFGMSRRNLQKGFQEHFGETVHEYILRNRMDQAKILLADRSLSVKSIALSLGYKFVENFTTAYKKRFNQAPRNTRL
jgi:AraC-like DNA-binding protein